MTALTGRVAVVTGASSGIGAGLAAMQLGPEILIRTMRNPMA